MFWLRSLFGSVSTWRFSVDYTLHFLAEGVLALIPFFGSVASWRFSVDCTLNFFLAKGVLALIPFFGSIAPWRFSVDYTLLDKYVEFAMIANSADLIVLSFSVNAKVVVCDLVVAST